MAVTWVSSAAILIIGLGYGPETGIKVGCISVYILRGCRVPISPWQRPKVPADFVVMHDVEDLFAV